MAVLGQGGEVRGVGRGTAQPLPPGPTPRHGRGSSRQELQQMRSFCTGWEICQTPSGKFAARVRDTWPGSRPDPYGRGTPLAPACTPDAAVYVDAFSHLVAPRRAPPDRRSDRARHPCGRGVPLRMDRAATRPPGREPVLRADRAVTEQVAMLGSAEKPGLGTGPHRVRWGRRLPSSVPFPHPLRKIMSFILRTINRKGRGSCPNSVARPGS